MWSKTLDVHSGAGKAWSLLSKERITFPSVSSIGSRFFTYKILEQVIELPRLQILDFLAGGEINPSADGRPHQNKGHQRKEFFGIIQTIKIDAIVKKKTKSCVVKMTQKNDNSGQNN